MYKLDWISVTQIRIFKAEEIPLAVVQMSSAANAIKDAFVFRQVTPLAPPLTFDPAGAVQFTSGEISVEGVVVAVPQLIVETRRIILSVSSTSHIANRVFESLKIVLAGIDARDPKASYDPIMTTEETVSTVRLDFPILNLFPASLADFSRGLTERLSAFGSKVHSYPSGIKFHVEYTDLPESLKAQNIFHLPKEVRIEVRNQTAPNDNVYYIQSPNPTDEHLELLDYISEVFSARQ
jgi:hypothetical protein